jgi:hypothetical protein
MLKINKNNVYYYSISFQKFLEVLLLMWSLNNIKDKWNVPFVMLVFHLGSFFNQENFKPSFRKILILFVILLNNINFFIKEKFLFLISIFLLASSINYYKVNFKKFRTENGVVKKSFFKVAGMLLSGVFILSLYFVYFLVNIIMIKLYFFEDAE